MEGLEITGMVKYIPH